MTDQQSSFVPEPKAEKPSKEERALATVKDTALDVYGERPEIREMAQRIKLMIYNGKNLTDAESMALAQYSVGNGLNPFVGEAYYLPGKGPTPGIAGWRKKADEQLEYERRNAKAPFARWFVEYPEPDESERDTFDPKPGDIVVKAIVTDSLSKTDWEQRVLGAYVKLVAAGVKDMDAAKELVGPRPMWTALGCVRASENFGGDAMSRYERACKRAEKAAIRKRFPRINLPEFEDADYREPEITVVEPKRTEAQNLADLGYSAQ